MAVAPSKAAIPTITHERVAHNGGGGGGPRGWGFGHALWLDASAGVGAGVGKVPVWVASFDSAIPSNDAPFSNFEFAASTVAAFAVQSSE
jgi:hypothetical protein